MVDPTAPLAGELSALFDTKRREVTGETLEQLRHNYYIAAKMSGDDATSIGGLAINPSGRGDGTSLAKKNEKKATSDMIMMAILDHQLQLIEGAMIKKYGEDFAEQFAAELLDEETFRKIMEINDPEERRKAIAISVHNGVKDGTIDPVDAYKNPDFKEWLDKHAEVHDYRSALNHAGASISGKIGSEQTNQITQGADEESAFDSVFAKNDFPT